MFQNTCLTLTRIGQSTPCTIDVEALPRRPPPLLTALKSPSRRRSLDNDQTLPAQRQWRPRSRTSVTTRLCDAEPCTALKAGKIWEGSTADEILIFSKFPLRHFYRPAAVRRRTTPDMTGPQRAVAALRPRLGTSAVPLRRGPSLIVAERSRPRGRFAQQRSWRPNASAGRSSQGSRQRPRSGSTLTASTAMAVARA